MELIRIEQKKLVASEGKDIVQKAPYLDENGNELEKPRAKVIYLAVNDSEKNYEEVDELERE